MDRFIQTIIRHPRAALAVWLLLTLAAGSVLTQAVISASMGRLFFGESPAYAAYIDRAQAFGYDEAIVVGVADVDPLAPDTLRRLQQVVRRLRPAATAADPDFGDGLADDGFGAPAAPPSTAPAATAAPLATPELAWIRRIHSVLSAERVRRAGDALHVAPYGDAALADPSQAPALLAELTADPLYGGRLVGTGGQHLAVVLELVPNPNRAEERLPRLIDAVLAAFVDAGFARAQLHLVGQPVMMAAMVAQTQRNLQAILPITALVLLGSVFLLFRRLWPALIAGAVAFTGVIWTMAVAVLIDPHISVMHSIAPGVILIVASSDVIHLCSAYLNELGHGRTQTDAIRASASEVGTACVYTSATTFLGFVALSFVPTPVFRQLGVILGAGVAFSLLIAVTVAPACFALMPAPAPWRSGTASTLQRGVDRLLGGAAGLVARRPRAMVAAWGVVLALSVAGLAQLNIETRVADRFGDDDAVTVDKQWFEAAFAPAAQLDLLVDTGHPGGALEGAFVTALAALEARLAERADIEAVFSITDVWTRVHRALAPPGAPLPTTREAFAQYALLFELGGADTLAQLMDFERQRVMVSLRLADDGVRAAWRTGLAAADEAQAALGPGITVTPSGILSLVGEWIDAILDGQRRGLAFSFLIIALMMMWALRSPWAGLWSMLPNLLPLLMLAGVVGAAQDATDSDTLVLAMLAIGIGVDDTIHFLVRYRIERQRAPDPQAALVRTFDFAGRAIVMTTVVLTLGFLPFALTDYYSTQVLGTLLPLTLVFALLADVLLVPALALLGPLDVGRGPRPPV